MTTSFRRLTAMLAVVLGAVPAAAETARFDLSFAGVRAGTLALQADTDGSRYTVRGAVRPTGLGALAVDLEIDTAANGRVDGNRYRPAAERAILTDGDGTRTRTIRYSGGVPRVSSEPPDDPSRHAAPPDRQSGTVDTTTAAFAILRDRPAGLACDLDLSIFDGERRHRITFDRATRTAEGLVCEGAYRRVAGFSPSAMAERTLWPLRMEYQRRGDTYQVLEVRFPTSFGTARIRRR